MEIGQIGAAELITEDRDLAKSISIHEDDDFPEVFATSRMIALMELAAARCMKDELKVGDLSVGVGVNIKHLAATPKGIKVRAEAKYIGKEGKLFCFEISAFDNGGLIGSGTHTRAIISTARLLSGANDRNSV